LRYVRIGIELGSADFLKHNDHIGDEALIENLQKMGRLGEKVPGGPDLTDTDFKTAKIAAAKAAGYAKI
jgi:hypothetical protein